MCNNAMARNTTRTGCTPPLSILVIAVRSFFGTSMRKAPRAIYAVWLKTILNGIALLESFQAVKELVEPVLRW
jgi:hypothetical protein